jgi:integrase
LKLLPLIFLRSSELSKAEWKEIDFEKQEWRIPAVRMKMKEIHIVPLSKQTMEILSALHNFSGNLKYLFPSVHSFERTIGHTTLLNAIRNMGYTKDEFCTHGFRGMASTFLNELGYNRDWIERQLAHSERSGVRAAYNYAQYLPERRKMMQEWADYLDTLREKSRYGAQNV